LIDRREFLAGTSAMLLASPLAAEAQQAKKVWRIGYLGAGPPLEERYQKALEEGLRELGDAPGQQITLEYRFAGGDPERLRQLALELVQMPADVIVAETNPAVAAAKQATSVTPIVMSAATNAIRAGFVQSLARPGGNVTGLTAEPSETLLGKQLALLKELVPRMSRVAVLWNPTVPAYRDFFDMLNEEARQLRVSLQSLEVQSPTALEAALGSARQQRAEGLVVFVDIVTFAHRREIAELALKHRLPSVAYVKEFAEAGGLLTYGANLVDLIRRAAYYIDRIIKGAKPADLPVEQPTKFALVINLKTAKALGLTIPQSLLGRADEVIQ
jgi:ABC-type uncharacterized transport system substrate-binding protein